MSSILAGLDNQILLEQQTYKLWESAGHKIVEAQLTADQIKQLFANIEQGATAAGGNRTMIGKGKDAAGAVSKAWEDLKGKIYNSGPMNNFAAAYDKQAEKLKQATGGDQGVFKYVQKYRDFAEKHPIIQGFVYSALIAAAGVTGAGLGGAAVLGLFKLTDQLLQGKDIRSAIYQGAKTGALAYGASKLGDLIKGKPEGEIPGANVSKLPANIPPDDFNNTYIKGLMKLKGLDPSDPDDQKIWTGWMTQGRDLSTIPNIGGNNPSGAAQAAFGGNPNDTMTPWGTMSDEALLKQSYDSAVQEFIKKYAQDPNNPSAQIVKMAKDAAKAKVYGKTMGESLSEATIKILFSKISLEHSKRIDEGIMDTLKGAAGKAMDYAKTKGHNLTTKVTADKLNTAWEKAGKPTESGEIATLLVKNGVPQDVMLDVFAKMKIPTTSTPAPAATPAAAAKPAAAPAQAAKPQPTAPAPAASAAQQPAAQPAQKPGAVNKTPPKSNTPVAGTRSQKGAFAYNPLAEGDFEVNVPGFGTVPLEMLKRHVKELAKDFNDMIQSEEFIKAAYKAEQFYNALFALSKAMKAKSVEEGYRAGAVGGAGLGIEKSPMEKVLEKPLGEAFRYYYPGATRSRIKKKVKKFKHGVTGFEEDITEGEVVSMQARKTPLVVAGSPFDWNVYDLRNNKMVANILGGDRSDSKLYEIRINSNGMTEETKMLPTYVLATGPNDNPPYKAFALVAPTERDKIEKSPGPGGTTKLKPDTMDVLGHMAKQTGQGKYYGYNMILVEDGLNQYELVEKALGAKIMDIDDAMELGYTDVDPEDSSSIVYLGNQKNEGYSAKLGEKINTPGGMGQSYRKFTPKSAGMDEGKLNELSSETLAKYKKAAGADAKKADKEGDFERGNKRFSGIVRATKKEFDKAVKEEQAPMFTPEDKIAGLNDPRSDGWRVYKAVPAGTKESAIMKGLQNEVKGNGSLKGK